MRSYDICVITAANDYQARGYQEQLNWRLKRESLPKETEFLVFPDPRGKRIGSGGSTIYVLYKLLEHFIGSGEQYHSLRGFFKGKRILILHSGGDSKRLPAYSAFGKIFTPLPTSFSPEYEKSERLDGFVTLFDIFFNNLTQLPDLKDGQVIATSGDVLLSFDATKITFSSSGITGLAYPGPLEVALGHGVYVVPQELSGENLKTVTDFLQKPTYEELKECNGLDIANRAFIDTGVMNFALDSVDALLDVSGFYIKDDKAFAEEGSLGEDLINADVQLDLYKEFPFAMLGKTEGLNIDSSLADTFRQTPFFVYLLPYCEFFHIGTSRHLLQNFYSISNTASVYDFQNFSKSKVSNRSALENAFVYNSFIDSASIRTDGTSFIEGCYLDSAIYLEGENILTNIPKGAGDIELRERVCMTCVPVDRSNGAWAPIIYGIEDNFKGLAGDESTTFLNDNFAEWIKAKGISASDLWKDDELNDLWNARLFPVSADLSESMSISLSLQKGESFQVDRWRNCPRMSLREILEAVDYGRFLDNYSTLCQKVNLENLTNILTPKSSLASDDILSWCSESNDYDTAARMSIALISQSESLLFLARLYKLLGNVLRKADERKSSLDFQTVNRIEALILRQTPSAVDSLRSKRETGSDLALLAESLDDIAFGLIRQAIGKGLEEAPDSFNYEQDKRIRIRSDEVVWVCAPSRLDFAGGWSDTPPYCMDYGGSVLNSAVRLNGQYPIQVIGKLHSEPFIKVNSIDLGERVIISEADDLLSYQDPSDWTSLVKAAFVVTGIVPKDTQLGLQHIFRELGTGIDLTIFSAVPAGSGLGTSSILGSAVITCLSRILGQSLNSEDLFNRTLYMEQLMTTGGGWQDQIGGVVGGVKHIKTDPGLYQIPSISWTDLKPKHNIDISGRFLLYYTGYRRMAKNILRNIVGKYLDRDKVVLETISRLREKSFEMKEELDHRDIDSFGKKIADVWELNKTLDPGTSNADIESILNRISPLICGAKLLGAGGGGFLFIVSKKVEQSKKIREILEESPPNDRARFFDFDIDYDGLKLNIL